MNITSPKWSGRILKMAKEIASWSKDQSTKVGAVITTPTGRPVSWGFNGMPIGIDDSIPERHLRPEKYKWFCHAERNALDLAPGDVTGCVMFVTFCPCSGCAQSIIQRGISVVVIDENFSKDKMPERWKDDMFVAMAMLREAGINVLTAYPDPPIDDDTAL